MFQIIRDRITKGEARSVTVKKNIVASLMIKGVSIAVSLLLVPLTLDYVSSELYGIWLILSSIVLWLNFFDVGFTLGLKNMLTNTLAFGNYERGKKLVSTTYVMLIMIFLPLLVLLESISPFINWGHLLNVNESHNYAICQAMSILLASFCLQMIVNVFTTVVSAFQKTALSSLFGVLGNVLSLLIIFILTKTSPPSLFLLALAISTTPIIVIAGVSIYFFNGPFCCVKPSIHLFDKSLIKELFGLGVKFFLIQIQFVVLSQATNLLISNVSTPIEVTNYNIALRYLSIATMIFNIILTPLWPAFTDAYTKGDRLWMLYVYKRMTSIVLITLAVLCLMTLISPIIYNIWVGDKVSISFALTISVAIYLFISIWVSLQAVLINGIGKIELQTYVTLIGIVVHIPLSLFLGKYIGALGVVCSMITVNLIYSCVLTPQIIKLIKGTAVGVWNR